MKEKGLTTRKFNKICASNVPIETAVTMCQLEIEHKIIKKRVKNGEKLIEVLKSLGGSEDFLE